MTRILVVEDSPTQAEILRAVMQGAGFEAEVAYDAESALEIFGREAFDGVISDIVMPGMSGYEFCHKLKASPKGREIPVILLSSLNDPMDIIRGLECEADSFITKPYQADRLIARVNSLLENRRARNAGSLKFGVELVFLGKRFRINSEREQILDLLISTFEDTVRTNLGLQKSQAELASTKQELEKYARELEVRVRQRTEELERKALQLNTALEESHKSEARFRTLVSSFALPLLVFDPTSMRILHVNDAAVHEYGYTHDEFLTLEAKDLLAETVMLSAKDATTQLLDPSRRLHRRHRRKSGEIIDMELSGTLVEFQGKPGFLIVANNITERLKNEAQLRHNERLDAVGSLTGGIAHDFNNLLTVIKATAEDLISELGEDSSLRPSAEMALEAADRGAELVRHLMAFARKQELMPTQINVNTLTDTIVKLIRRTFPSNISIKFVKKDGLPLINMDASRLQNAILNLAVNARDAMPDGGELVLETGMAELDEQYARENPDVHAGRYVLVAISDTGTGMPQEVIDHAFEPFFTTKGVGKGTGLGLSMVYGLIKQSGGHAKIYSVVGKGTTIKLYLPVGAEAESVVEKAAAAPTQSAQTNSGRVLLVEDDELVRKSVTAKLKRLGYDITAVNSAAEAVAMLEKTCDFKLMLSDVMMPGTMTGADLAREVQHRWPHIGVLLSSGYTESSIGGKVRIPEGVRLLSKPYSNSDLASALKETLAKQYA